MITWNQNEHAQVLVGYDTSGFWLDNPDYTYRSQGQWLWHYTTAQFTAGWAVLGNQAVVVARGHQTAIRHGRSQPHTVSRFGAPGHGRTRRL